MSTIPPAGRSLPALALLGATFLAAPALAQDAAGDDAVRAAVTQLFDGMRAADTTMIRDVLHPDVRLLTVVDEKTAYRVAETDMGRFLAAVAGAPVTFDERVGEVTVQVDEGLASAWMTYEFYAGETFSHCGVNAMQLVLDEPVADGTDPHWRIVHIIDTRRTEGCDE